MDPTRPIVYRGFDFNSVGVDELGQRRGDGCTVHNVQYGDVEVVGYTEKRALDDGKDASDVYEGGRRIILTGDLLGSTKSRFYDNLRAMEVAISPREAYRESPADQGYLPLLFFEPTENVSEWSEGLIPLYFRVRALSHPSLTFDRKTIGGLDGDPTTAPYTVIFEAKDPRKYATSRSEHILSGSDETGILNNRGLFPTNLQGVLVAVSDPTFDRIFTFVGGGTTIRVKVPKGPDTTVVRLDGKKKIATLNVIDVESLAQNLIEPVGAPWPVLVPGENDILWTFRKTDGTDATLQNTSLLYFQEALG